MLFNSLQFAIFFIIVYSLYLVLNHRWQNRMLLVASYVFYGSWDWRFLSLIIISTVLDFYCGLKIKSSVTVKRRKFFLFLSILVNLSILGFFKYFNFFSSNLQVLLTNFNIALEPRFFQIILPLGISFYTFQTMSYTIDIYRGKLEPTNKFFDFALFVAFFPQLVAGPIERAKHLLPQILSPRQVTLPKFYTGCYLIFWGLFQKVFIADNLARLVDGVFGSQPPYNGFTALISIYAFAFQIFCDFAGYSNIARGLGSCMGFDIMVNFNLPYFATNPRQFWQRWHISLSSWLRDYLYIPLGGNRHGNYATYRNIAITMLLGGLWHGASWTFVLWGAYQAILLIGYRLISPFLERIHSPRNGLAARVWRLIRIIFFFHLICLGWLIFRAQSLTQIVSILQGIFGNFQLITGWENLIRTRFIMFVWLLLAIQYLQYRKDDLLAVLKLPALIRGVIYFIIYYLIMVYGVEGGKEFIYFVF